MNEAGEALAPHETVDFGGLEIAFDHQVLRPRSWTVAQSQWAAAELRLLPDGDVLELCAGAGQIGLLAVADSDRRLVCVDANPVATAFTLRNAEAAGLAARVAVREGLISDALRPEERYPMIIADPPWVPHEQIGRFPEDPALAIDGGDDGLTVVRQCVEAIITHLAPGGVALLQLGTTAQAEHVAKLLAGTDLSAGELREYGERGVLLRVARPVLASAA